MCPSSISRDTDNLFPFCFVSPLMCKHRILCCLLYTHEPFWDTHTHTYYHLNLTSICVKILHCFPCILAWPVIYSSGFMISLFSFIVGRGWNSAEYYYNIKPEYHFYCFIIIFSHKSLSNQRRKRNQSHQRRNQLAKRNSKRNWYANVLVHNLVKQCSYSHLVQH